jgi:hypothetical protein
VLEKGGHIKFNGYDAKGYTNVETHTIIVDGKEVELSQEGYEQIKKLVK